MRGSYTYLDDKGVQHSVHYIAGPETGYRVLKHVKGPHLPTVFPFGRREIIPPDFYDYGKVSDVFDTAASGHVKPSGDKQSTGASSGGAKDEVPNFEDNFDKGKDEFSFDKKPLAGNKPGGSKPSYFDDDSGDFGDIFGGDFVSSTTSRPTSTGSYRPQRPSSDEDDGSYKPSGEDGSYKPPIPSFGSSTTTTFRPTYGGSTTSRPSFGGSTTTRPTSDSSESVYENGGKPFPSFSEGSTRPTIRPKPTGSTPSQGGGGKPSSGSKPVFGDYGKPSSVEDKLNSDTDSSSNEVNDFGLFGSESERPRPPYAFGGKPVINIGLDNTICSKCLGTVVTNLGGNTLYVPPGVSVRAHVQAIDLLPINPSIPSPGDQFNADLKLKTEQLNAAEDAIVKNNQTDIRDTTTASTTSSTVKDTKNSTNL